MAETTTQRQQSCLGQAATLGLWQEDGPLRRGATVEARFLDRSLLPSLKPGPAPQTLQNLLFILLSAKVNMLLSARQTLTLR